MPNKLRGSYTFLGLYTCFFKKKEMWFKELYAEQTIKK